MTFFIYLDVPLCPLELITTDINSLKLMIIHGHAKNYDDEKFGPVMNASGIPRVSMIG